MDNAMKNFKIKTKFVNFTNEDVKKVIKKALLDNCIYFSYPHCVYYDLKKKSFSQGRDDNKNVLPTELIVYTVDIEDNLFSSFKYTVRMHFEIDNEKEIATVLLTQDKNIYSYYMPLDNSKEAYYYNETSKRKLKSSTKFDHYNKSYLVMGDNFIKHPVVEQSSLDKVFKIAENTNNYTYRNKVDLIISYFEYRKKYPEIDSLLQKEFPFSVDMMYHNVNLYDHFFKGTTFKKNFILPKDCTDYLSEHKLNNATIMGHLNKLQFATKAVNLEIVKQIMKVFEENTYYGNLFLNDFVKIIIDHHIDMKQAFAYLERVDTYQAVPKKDAIGIWKDYLNNMKKLNIADFNKYPSSLKREHDISTREAIAVRNELEEQTFKDIMKKYEDIVYENDKYCIIVPKVGQDLIDEGRALNHCVGTYVSQVINHYCVIFFVREKENKDIPLYTLEIRNNALNQFRGKFNCAPNAAAIQFAKNFIKDEFNNIISGAVADLAM